MKKIVLAALAAGLLVAESGAGLAGQDSDRLSAAQRKFETLAFVARRDCAPAIGPQLVGFVSVGAGALSAAPGEFCIPR